MQKIRTLIGVVVTLAAVTACSNTPAATDAGGTTDAGHEDAGNHATDAGTSDGGSDAGPMDDAARVMGNDAAIDGGGPTVGTCTMPIDVDATGTALATGTGKTVDSTNVFAAAGTMAGLANGSCADDGMGGSTATNEVVFRYTMQTTAHLVASTDNATTDPNLDSIVWILDACSATATERACNDDAGAALLSTATTDATIAAGTTVFVVVAGYMGADVPASNFTLTLTELAPHAAGAACDQTNPFCVDGYGCVILGTATSGTCNAYGSEYAPCNLTTPFCDTGLTCSEAAPTATTNGTCQMPIATGDPCTPDHFLCVTGSTCIADAGSMTMGHCIADGSAGGACRATTPECDGTLTCDTTTGLCH